MGYAVRDVNAKATRALPASAGTVYSAGIDLGNGPKGDFVAEVEVKISAPALNTTQLPDTRTMTYSVQQHDDADFGAPTTIQADVIVQTGAGGAGAAAATYTFRLKLGVERYIRLKVVGGSSIGDCTGATATLELLF